MQSRAQTLGQEIEGLRDARELQTQELDESRTRLLSLEQIAQELRDKRAEMQQSLQRKRDLVVRARMALQQAQRARIRLPVNLRGAQSAQALHGPRKGARNVWKECRRPGTKQ